MEIIQYTCIDCVMVHNNLEESKLKVSIINNIPDNDNTHDHSIAIYTPSGYYIILPFSMEWFDKENSYHDTGFKSHEGEKSSLLNYVFIVKKPEIIPDIRKVKFRARDIDNYMYEGNILFRIGED